MAPSLWDINDMSSCIRLLQTTQLPITWGWHSLPSF